jgi:hypothetical protein
MRYTQRHDNFSDSPAKAGQAMWQLKKSLTHEIAIKIFYTPWYDNLSDSMWQLTNNN